MNGKIIAGFPGVGKSSLCKIGCIDLRSDCFWIGEGEDKIRPIGWYESFCNVAIDLARQGYIVFIPTHNAIRMYLTEHNIDYTVIYPNDSLKEQWIEKIKTRYENNPNRETKSALEAVSGNWDEFQIDLKSDNHKSIVIDDMNYNLKDLIWSV